MAKEILFNMDARDQLKKGVDELANAVKVTLQSYACDISLFGHKRGSGESIWDIKKHIGYVLPEMHRSYKQNLPAIERMLPKSKKNLVKEYPGLNHLFQHCTTGLVNEYRQIEETISPEVLSDIATWIKGLSPDYPL